MSVALSDEALAAFATFAGEDSPLQRLAEEGTDAWRSRVVAEAAVGDGFDRDHDTGQALNPPADLSRYSSAEIEAEVRRVVVAHASYRGSRFTANAVNREMVVLPRVSSVVVELRQGYDQRLSLDCAFHAPVEGIFGDPSLYLAMSVECVDARAFTVYHDLGLSKRFEKVYCHSIDPRRNLVWGGVARKSGTSALAQREYIPKRIRINEVIRPVLVIPAPGSGSSREIAWLAHSEIGPVLLDWWWWAWEGSIAHDREVQFVPAGPTIILDGKEQSLQERSRDRDAGGKSEVPMWIEVPPWILKVYCDQYAVAEVGPLCRSGTVGLAGHAATKRGR